MFWLASGYSLDFGLIGGVVKTGTFNQFIRGGIAFATPPGTPLAPKAQMASTSCCRRASRKSGGSGAPLCRSNAFSRPGQRRARGGKPHAPVSRAGAFCKLRTLFFCGALPVAENTVYFPEAFRSNARGDASASLFRRLYRRLSAPATPQYSRQYAED